MWVFHENLCIKYAPEPAPAGALKWLPRGPQFRAWGLLFSGGLGKVGPRVWFQLPDCSPQGCYDMLYSTVTGKHASLHVRFMHACVCFSLGSLNHLPVRFKLYESKNLNISTREKQMHTLHPTAHVCFTVTRMNTHTQLWTHQHIWRSKYAQNVQHYYLLRDAEIQKGSSVLQSCHSAKVEE